MSDQLKVLAVDQNTDALAALRRALNFADLEIVHEAGFGPVALTWARTLQPDVVLVATEEPLARSLGTIQTLAQGAPGWTVVALAARFEPELFRKAVLAGARDVVLRATTPADLRGALFGARRADLGQRTPVGYDPSAPAGTIVTVFGVKGGIGKTTMASNLAVALATETRRSVALVDLDLPFGDLAMVLDLKPERSVADALDPAVLNDPERLQAQLTPGPAGVRVLAAPLDPTAQLTIDGEQVATLLGRLAALHDFVVVDTPPGINEITAPAVDAAALALLVATPEVACLRRTQACLQLLQSWRYSQDKLKLVLNRTGSKTGVKDDEVEALVGYPVAWRIANDRTAANEAALGQSSVVTRPRSPLAVGVRDLARQVAGLPPARAPFWQLWSSRTAAMFA